MLFAGGIAAMDGLNEFVLYFSPDPVHVSRTLAVCEGLGIRARLVLPNEADQTVGHLAGLPGYARAAAPLASVPLAQPCMVLSGVSRARMDAFFAALRASNAPPADRKAVLTPTNAGWTLRALSAELGREHAATHHDM